MNRCQLVVAILFTVLLSSNSLFSNPLAVGVEIYKKNAIAVCDITSTAWLSNGEKSVWPGTGFFVDKVGHILTVDHVVQLDEDDPRTPKVVKYTYDVVIRATNRRYTARLIGANRDADIALLLAGDIRSGEFEVATIGNPDKLQIGEMVWALGNPRTFSNTLTTGIVSALHRRLEHSYLEDHIQTDCPINFGNSGSPLFNESGEVVGINQRIVRDTEGLNFAVSINVARVDLLRKGHIETPSIGFDCLLANFPRKGRSQRPHPEDIKFLRERIGMSVENCFVLAKDSYSNCAIITDFLDPRGKPGLSLGAKDFGLEMGDLVISLDGEVIKNGMDVRMFLVGKQAGDIVKVRFRRAENGKMVDRTIPVSLTPRPSKI